MPFINLKEINPVWKTRLSKTKNRVYYRKWDDKYVNAGLLKNGNVYVSVDGKLVQEHNIKFTNEVQLFKDIDAMLETLVIID